MAVGALAWVLAGCAETELAIHATKEIESGGAAAGGVKIGEPYQVDGAWYYPEFDPYYDETGIASWYGAEFHGRRTANGELFDMNQVTAAHKTLPLPSNVRVTNLENGRSIVVRVNDRGPFVNGRIVDLSRRSAQLLGLNIKGTAMVRVQMLPISQQPAILVAELRREGYELPEGAEDLRLAYSETPPNDGVAVVELEPPSAQTANRDPAAGQDAAEPGGGGLIASASAAELPAAQTAPQALNTPRMYVQAGAFADAANAAKLQRELSAIGPAKITPVIVNGQVLYRVRLGPYDELGAADGALDEVIHSGHPQARLIAD